MLHTFCENCFKAVKEDELTFIARNDPLIAELGNSHGRKCSGMNPQKRRHYVAQEMRQSAKLLQELRALES